MISLIQKLLAHDREANHLEPAQVEDTIPHDASVPQGETLYQVQDPELRRLVISQLQQSSPSAQSTWPQQCQQQKGIEIQSHAAEPNLMEAESSLRHLIAELCDGGVLGNSLCTFYQLIQPERSQLPVPEIECRTEKNHGEITVICEPSE